MYILKVLVWRIFRCGKKGRINGKILIEIFYYMLFRLFYELVEIIKGLMGLEYEIDV